MYERILVTLDGSRHAEAAIEEASRLDGTTIRKILVLQVVPVPAGTPAAPKTEPLVVPVGASGAALSRQTFPLAETKGQAIARVAEETHDHLEGVASRLKAPGVEVESVVRFGDAVAEITRFISDERIDLVVMATHGHTGLARQVLGSVAMNVVHSGALPVLLVRPRGLREE